MIHPPKVELFDIAAMTNTDPKGIVRTVQTYRQEPFGLYMARPTPGRKQFDYLESWLLPELDLRISYFHPTEHSTFRHHFYFDLALIERGDVWKTTDVYLDLVQNPGEPPEVWDIDELLEANASGQLSAEVTERAFTSAFNTVQGLAAHGYRLDDWLATMNITVSWCESLERSR